MPSFHKIHLILISLWAGLVLAEVVIELLGRDDESRRQTARLHYWIDLVLEIPIVLGVLASGLFLLRPLWPPTGLLAVKIALGLTAIAINLVCAAFVIRRRRVEGDSSSVLLFSRRIRLTILGLPFGLAAFYLGIAYFGH